MKRIRAGIRARLREPVLVDRRIDVMSAILWLLYGVWGVFASISESTIARAAGSDYNVPWGLSIGILGLLAGVAALSTLFASKPRWRIYKKSVELVSVSVMTGIIGVFPVLKVLGMFHDHFSSLSISAAALALTFVVVPTWRIFHLTDRIRGLRKIENE